MKKSYIFISIFLLQLCYSNTFSQLQVSPSNSTTQIQQIVQNQLGGGGISISNISYTGSLNAIGSFQTGAVPTNLGISYGLMLASGNVTNAIGPNITGSSGTNLNTSGDSLLGTHVSALTYDAAVLEFDFVSFSDSIKFTYIFGSEEYPEYVNSFNDIFCFFLSGQRPDSGFYNNVNIAQLPNTSIPVSIYNVNNGTSNNGPCSNCAYYVNNTNGTSIQYDGFTVAVTSKAWVIPGKTYHIKIAIADVGDGIFDSGVFIKGESLSSYTPHIEASLLSANANFECEEGNNVVLVEASISQVLNTDYCFYLDTSWGTASNGIDFSFVEDSIVIPAGQLSKTINICPINDNLIEGTETFHLVYRALGTIIDTLHFNIIDPISSFIKNEKLQADFYLFPNPANSILNISFSESYIDKEIKVFNMLGEVVFHIKYSENNLSIDLSNLESGIYSVQIYTNSKLFQQNFVKQ